jgi:RND family efflux transporter MFP subunit
MLGSDIIRLPIAFHEWSARETARCRRVRQTALLTLLVSAVCLAQVGCTSASTDAVAGDGGGPGSAAAAPPPALVRVAQVLRRDVAPTVVAVGTVRARDASVVASGADGVVEAFCVEEGDYVRQGSLLSQLRLVSTDLELEQQRAVLDERKAEYELLQSPRKEDVDEARAILDVAEATMANAQRRFDELQRLQKSNAVGDSTVLDGQNALLEATRSRDAAKAAFERAAAGAREESKLQARARMEAQRFYVQFLEAEKEKRFTRAPFDGFVAKRQSYIGQWLSKETPVITLLDLSEVDVEVLIDQEFIAQVNPGDAVSLKIPGARSSSDGSQSWQGTVHSVVSQSAWESGSRSFPVVIRVPNVMRGPEDNPQPLLREGMMAEATFSGSPVDALLVPKDSMVRTSRGTFVFAVNPPADGQPPSVRQVMVEPGISQDSWIQVRGTDLTAGTQVVTEGAERLRAFQTIQIMSDATASTEQ